MQMSQVALDLRVSFFIRKSYVNEDGKNPIILRTGYRGETRDTFTNFFIHNKHWITGVGRVSMDEPKASIINTGLEQISREAKDHFDELKYSRQEFSIDELVQKIRGKDQVPETLMDYVEETIKDYQLRVGVDMSLATFYKYQRVKNYLVDFLSTSRKVKNLPISRVDDRLLHQFFLFLRKEKQNNNNSALTLLNFLKTVLLQPLKRGQIKENPFTPLRLRFNPVDVGFLSMAELERIQNCTLTTPGLQRDRDIFLFCCYTGMAYIDVKQFKAEHLFQDPDGSYYIKKSRQKTHIISIIPLLPVAERILLKYSPTGDIRDFIFFITANQKLNFNLKKIGEIAGIAQELHMHKARHTFATTVTLLHKVPIETVSKMLGHSSLKHTLRYARVIGEKVKSDMAHVKGIFR